MAEKAPRPGRKLGAGATWGITGYATLSATSPAAPGTAVGATVTGLSRYRSLVVYAHRPRHARRHRRGHQRGRPPSIRLRPRARQHRRLGAFPGAVRGTPALQHASSTVDGPVISHADARQRARCFRSRSRAFFPGPLFVRSRRNVASVAALPTASRA